MFCTVLRRTRQLGSLGHQHLFNRFLKWQRPPFGPSRHSRRVGQCLPGLVKTCVQSGLFGRRERSANVFAQCSRGACQPQRSLCFKLSGRGTCETLQQAGNSALVVQLAKQLYAFPVHRTRGEIVPLFSRQVPQISQRAGNSQRSPRSRKIAKPCSYNVRAVAESPCSRATSPW